MGGGVSAGGGGGMVEEVVVRKCTVEGCDNDHNSRGFCIKHYSQYKKYGKTFTQKEHRNSFLDEFTNLPVSRQRKWQLRHKRDGKCQKCSNNTAAHSTKLCQLHWEQEKYITGR